MNKHADRYLKLAKEVAQWSKDPSSKIGCVVVGHKGQILSQGYNGFPRGIEDRMERLIDRETKYHLVVHAEKNAIYNACLNGVSLDRASMYVYGLPICSECAKGIIQVGITDVYLYYSHINRRQDWLESWNKSRALFDEAGVTVHVVYDEIPGSRLTACPNCESPWEPYQEEHHICTHE